MFLLIKSCNTQNYAKQCFGIIYCHVLLSFVVCAGIWCEQTHKHYLMCFNTLCAPSFMSQFTVPTPTPHPICSCWSTVHLLHCTQSWCISCVGTSVPLSHYRGKWKQNLITWKLNSPTTLFTWLRPTTFWLHPPLGCTEQNFSLVKVLKVVGLLFGWLKKKKKKLS